MLHTYIYIYDISRLRVNPVLFCVFIGAQCRMRPYSGMRCKSQKRPIKEFKEQNVYCSGAKDSYAALNQEAAYNTITGKYFEPRLIITLRYDLRFVIKIVLDVEIRPDYFITLRHYY